MEIAVQNLPEYSVLKISGEIDLYNVDDLKKEFSHLLDKNVYKIGVDLGEVSYIDSSGLGAFLSIIKEIKKNKGKLLLFNLSQSVQTIMNLTRLSSFFDIAETVDGIMS